MIPALGLGLMGLSIAYGKVGDDEERFQLLDRAVELGATNWDSSDLYGDNERLLNKWFKLTGKRDQIFLATKFGFVRGAGMSHHAIDSSGAYCKQACAKSLETLGVDCIDLYYMHRAKRDVPIEETMRAMAELKAEGKIKYIGLSEVSSTTLRRACKIAHVDAVQIEYSPFVIDVETSKGTNLLNTCRELGVAVIAYSPLGRGILTGTLTKETLKAPGEMRSMLPWFHSENFDVNLRLVQSFTALAEAKGCTPAQLAIAWLLKQGEDVIPIPGTKRIKYLEENWGALKVVISDEDEKAVRGFIENAKIAGARTMEYDPSFADTREEE